MVDETEQVTVVVMQIVPPCAHLGERCGYARHCEFVTDENTGHTCDVGPLRHGLVINDGAYCESHGITISDDELGDHCYWTEWEDLAGDCEECGFDCPCKMPTLIGAKAYAAERFEREEKDGTNRFLIDTEVGTYTVIARDEPEAMVFHRAELSEKVGA